MCPPKAAEKIDNLLISVNESGCTTGETLLAAYKEHTKQISQKKGDTRELETDVIVADDHKPRFNANVMSHGEQNSLDQFILPSGTSGVAQKHDQINQHLHSNMKRKSLKCILSTQI